MIIIQNLLIIVRIVNYTKTLQAKITNIDLKNPYLNITSRLEFSNLPIFQQIHIQFLMF